MSNNSEEGSETPAVAVAAASASASAAISTTTTTMTTTTTTAESSSVASATTTTDANAADDDDANTNGNVNANGNVNDADDDDDAAPSSSSTAVEQPAAGSTDNATTTAPPPAAASSSSSSSTSGENKEKDVKSEEEGSNNGNINGQQQKQQQQQQQQRNQSEWDHTSRKVVVHGVLKYIRAKEMTKITSSWLQNVSPSNSIVIEKTKKPPKDSWIKVTLASECMVNPFIELINKGGINGKAMVNGRGRPLFAKRADENFVRGGGGGDGGDGGGGGDGRGGGDDNDRKRKGGGDGGDNNNADTTNNNHNKRYRREDKQRPPIAILSSDGVRDKITPLWRMTTYEEQLDTKAREMVNKCALKIVKEIKAKFRILERESKRGQRKGNVRLYGWLEGTRCIELQQPVPSPRKYEYRNKCEYTVGYRLVQKKEEEEEEEKKKEEEKNGGVDGVGAEVVAKDADGGAGKGDDETKNDEGKDVEMKDVDDAKVKESTAGTEGDAAGAKDGDDATARDGDVDAKEEAAPAKGGGDDDGDATMANAADDDHAKVEGATAARAAPAAPSVVPAEEVAELFDRVPAAGFLAQGWSGGVYAPHCLQNMPDWACGLADILNGFLPTSPLLPYDSKVHRGFWRTVTMRCSLRTRECMVIVLHAPPKGGAGALADGSDDYSESFEGEKRRLVELLTKEVIPTPGRDYPEGHVKEGGDGTEEKKEGIRVTSIFFQEYEGLSHPTPDHPVQHVYGKKSIEEKLGKCAFQISPGAFFQTNTEGAEVLYGIVVDRIKEVTEDPKRTLLLDVCCGTGTIGLTCLKEGVVGRLVGVDIAEPAIADARINAGKNGFADEGEKKKASTTKFIASAAEKALPDAMRDIPRGEPIVAVVDPARDGLHGVVIRTLRANERIQRLVYVSCNPTGTLVRDAGMLCSPPTKKYPGRPFKPTMGQPVDMFPLTKHCEMVMTFDRMSEEEYEKYHPKEGK